MLTKQQIDETIQLLTREKAAPEEKKAVEAGLLLLAKMKNLDLVYTAIERHSSTGQWELLSGFPPSINPQKMKRYSAMQEHVS